MPSVQGNLNGTGPATRLLYEVGVPNIGSEVGCRLDIYRKEPRRHQSRPGRVLDVGSGQVISKKYYPWAQTNLLRFETLHELGLLLGNLCHGIIQVVEYDDKPSPSLPMTMTHTFDL